MNASRLPKNTPEGDAVPPLEPVPGPVARQHVEPHWLGVPARFFLLCLGFAAFGASIGLFATGSWAWGFVAFVFAAILLAALGEAIRRHGGLWVKHSSRLAADGRAQAATVAEVWRTRFESSLTRWRTRTRLDDVDAARAPALQALGEAVWRGDSDAEERARHRLVELEDERQRIEEELAQRLADAEQRISRARLPVQKTLMVTPNSAGSVVGEAADAQLEDPGPNAPYPPPDEGDPPQPAQVPEPYPPPDEGTPPVPAPDPGQADE